MTLNHNNLTIHVGDKVGFKGFDDIYTEGIVKGTVRDDSLSLLIEVSEFQMCTIYAKQISRVNNLFISLNNLRDNLIIGVAL